MQLDQVAVGKNVREVMANRIGASTPISDVSHSVVSHPLAPRTLPYRYRLSIGAKKFMNDWSKADPAHHCAIGVGHIASKIEKLGALLELETIRVC